MRSSWWCFCSLLLVLGTGFVLPSPPLFAHGAEGSWQLIPSPLPPAGTTYFVSDVAASGPRDAWIVGSQNIERQGVTTLSRPLIEHWDGRSWEVVPSPETGSPVSMLRSVAVASAHCAIVVGVSYPSLYASGRAKGLIEQWDGIRWHVVPAPDAGPYSELESVMMVPHTHSAWAVGVIGEYDASHRTSLIDTFDGTQWRKVAVPPLVSRNALTGVSASSEDNMWAIGVRDDTAGLLMHMDGQQWSIQQPALKKDYLISGILATSGQTAWSVGRLKTNDRIFAEHWIHGQWESMQLPDVGDRSDYAGGIAAFSDDDVWVVGSASGAHTGALLAQHWDGTHWNTIPVVVPRYENSGFSALANVPGSHALWALGGSGEWRGGAGGAFQIITELYQQDPEAYA